MYKLFLVKLSLACICSSFFSHSKAQTALEVGIGGGAFVYQGELAPWRMGSPKTASPGLQIFVAKPFLPFLAVRAAFAYTNLKGNETLYGPEFRQFRAFKFSNQVKELSLSAQFKFLSINTIDPVFEPYILAGAGLSFTDVTRDYSGFVSEYFPAVEDLPARIARDAAITPASPILVIPVGAGVQYHLSPQLSVSLEGNYRLTQNDYIDGFSIAANPKSKDHYTSLIASVIYSFGQKGKGLGCPVNVR